MNFKKILSIIIIIALSTILAFAYNASTNLSLRLLEATDDVRPFREDFNYNFELVDDIFDDVSLTEYGYLDGVTSAIQTQLNAKQALDAQLTDVAGLAVTDGGIIVGDGTNFVLETGVTARASLGLTIGTNVQAYDAGLLSIAGLTTAANDMIYTTALDTYAIMDTFAELQAIVADKTLVNEEDVFTIDANWVNTSNPWADNEVDDNITIDLATLATTITVTDNESTNENNPICFVAGADPDGGSLGIETDGDLHYNPSTGTLTATAFSGTAGYTNLTSFVDQTAWRVFYSNTDGDIVELALGADGTYLESNGAAAAPTFTVPSGAGDVSKVGTPVDSQVGVWTGDGTIEGAATLTYDGSNLQLTGDIGATGARITKGWFANLETTGDLTVNGTALASIYEGLLTNEAGLYAALSDVALFLEDTVDDTSPELGGEMDAGAHSIGFTLQTATGDGATLVNWTIGNHIKFTFGAQNETITFTDPSNPCHLSMIIVQDGTGSRTFTWSGMTIKWAGGTAPTLSTGANAEDVISFIFDGTNYYGMAGFGFATP